MKKKLIKQKRRLFISISVSLLALSIIVYAVFAVTTYYSELDLLTSNSASSFHQATVNMQNLTNNNWGNYLLNRKYDKKFKDISDDFDVDEQIKITENDTGAILCQTGNAVSVAFEGDIEHTGDEISENDDSIEIIEKSYVTDFGCIEFEHFKNSMTDKQYSEISDYLTKKTPVTANTMSFYVPNTTLIKVIYNLKVLKLFRQARITTGMHKTRL